MTCAWINRGQRRDVGVVQVLTQIVLTGLPAGDHGVGAAVVLPNDGRQPRRMTADRLPVGVRLERDLGVGLEADRDVRAAVDAAGKVAERVQLGRRVLDRDRGEVGGREQRGDQVEVALVHLAEVHHAVGAGAAVNAGDVFPTDGAAGQAGVVLVHDPFPRGLEVGAGDGLAIGPLHAGLEGPGDVHA